MAQMIKCPACARGVSSEAAACPECGQPIAAKKNQDAVIGKVIVIAILVRIIVWAILGSLWGIHQSAAAADKATRILEEKP